ncbi:MAG: hypothetical protein ACRC62_30980 [Microcoleus sp.]
MQQKKGRGKKEEGRRKKEEGRGKKEEGRGKKEEGRRKKEEGRGKKEEGVITHYPFSYLILQIDAKITAKLVPSSLNLVGKWV